MSLAAACSIPWVSSLPLTLHSESGNYQLISDLANGEGGVLVVFYRGDRAAISNQRHNYSTS